MFTCPQCNREMYVTCGSKDCKCWNLIPEGELPLIDEWLLFKKFIIPLKLGSFLWKTAWTLNLGHWIEKIAYKIHKKRSNWKPASRWMYLPTHYLGFRPEKFLFEVQRCPYCGFREGYGFWEDRSYQQLLESEGVNSLTELHEKRNKTQILS